VHELHMMQRHFARIENAIDGILGINFDRDLLSAR
jgi:hypothetical protein